MRSDRGRRLRDGTSRDAREREGMIGCDTQGTQVASVTDPSTKTLFSNYHFLSGNSSPKTKLFRLYLSSPTIEGLKLSSLTVPSNPL